MPTRPRPVALTIGVSLVAGCSFVTTIRGNTDAIGGSSASAAANTAVAHTSTSAMSALVPALRGVDALKTPMEARCTGKRSPAGF